MLRGKNRLRALGLLVVLVALPCAGFRPAVAQELGRLGRLFRLRDSASSPTSGPGRDQSALTPEGVTRGPVTVDPRTVSTPAPAGPANTEHGSIAPQPRLIPQPRNYRGVTDSDPIVTRMAIGRTDDGTQFGTALQVYADGTVIDNEGVHRLGREGIKPILDALRSDELYRFKGHCGGPPTDFVEHVQIIVFERTYGRLRANAFSYSGNQQGCDASIRALQAALETVQNRLGRNVTPVAAGTTSNPAPPALSASAPPPGPLTLNPSSPPIQLNAPTAEPVRTLERTPR